jgi:hypothetical protein
MLEDQLDQTRICIKSPPLLTETLIHSSRQIEVSYEAFKILKLCYGITYRMFVGSNQFGRRREGRHFPAIWDKGFTILECNRAFKHRVARTGSLYISVPVTALRHMKLQSKRVPPHTPLVHARKWHAGADHHRLYDI